MSARQLLVAAGAAIALLVVPSAVADAPSLRLPGPITVNVDGVTSVNVSYDDYGGVGATDGEDGTDPVTCAPASGSSFSVGTTTTVNCSATDSIGDSASGSFSVKVEDTTAPFLSLPASFSVEVVGVVSAPNVTYTATATDGATPSCGPTSGSTFPYGPTTVNCSASDTFGNTRTGSFAVTVQDTVPPALTVPASFTVVVNGVSSTPVSYTTSATESATVSCDRSSGSSFPLGSTLVTCTATDAAGNTSAPKSFTVTVSDTTPPTLTVPAPISVNVNNATTANVSYTATATDGATPLVPTCVPASGSSFPLGVTTVTCNATDAAGNTATPKSFTVTVSDTTPPAVAIVSGPPAASNSRSASFSFTTSEGTTTCRVDGGSFSACSSPSSYTGLADGPHTFDVRAVDAAGTSATASRAWKVDATAPVLSLPATRVGEADGPNGAVASFTVTASDAGAALLPSAVTCNPGSGSLFPLGTTTVTCRAADAYGNVATGSFDVVIQDTTAPAINAPNVSFTATSAGGVRRTDPAVTAYLAGVSASDLVSAPTLTNDLPDVLAIGKTIVVFTAKDAAGNVAKKSATVTVLPVGQTAPPPDLTPPGNVVGAKAKPGDRSVTLSWKPLAKDIAAVAVTDFVAGEPGVGRQIYRGTATTVTAKGLVNGTSYRFLIVTYDKAGNRSKGIVLVATPKAEALKSPAQAQRVTRPPLLRWAPVPGAAYFNVQLWRGSEKVLSAWPAQPRYQLAAKWVFGGKARKLAPGLYTWYVWPGLGARADVRYGALLGSRTFTVTAPKR